MSKSRKIKIDLSHSNMLRIEATKHAKCGRPILLLHGIENGECTCGKSGCQSPGKHPIYELTPKGHLDATTDVERIEEWIDLYPYANLGMVPVGLCVFDYDGSEGLALREIDNLPKTASARTGKGRHDCYLADHAPTKIRSRPGFDIKGENGYIVVQPSRHIVGKPYRWARPLSEAIALPRKARELITPPKKTNVDQSTPDLFAEGSRNDGLTKVAGSLRRQGFGADLITEVLGGVNNQLCKPPLDSDEIFRIADSIMRYEPESDDLFGSIDDVQEKIPEFLWYPWILKGGVTILEGMPAQGKSFLTMKIATEVSRGGSLPGQDKVEKGRVLVLNPEDDAGYTIKPRLRSMGANLSNIRYGKRLFNFTEENLSKLQAEIIAHKIKLVTVDPLTAFLGGDVDLYRDNEVRQYMAKLAEIASISRCSFVVVRHLTKAATADPMSRGSGSIGISAAARSVILVGNDPNDEDIRAMAHIKMNIAKKGKPLTFALSGGDARVGEMPEFIWCGEADYDAYAILAGPKREAGRPAEASADARQFLINELSNGPRAIDDLNRLAERRSISTRTLRRVAAELQVDHVKLGKKKAWKLPAKI